MDIFIAIVEMIVVLILILILITITLKLGGKKYNDMQKGRYIKVIEKVPVTKDNAITLVKLGEKGYILTSSNGKLEKLKELTEEEMLKIENDKKQANEEIIKRFNYVGTELKEKIKSIKIRGRRR